jgi:hypothetical protein
LLLLARVLFSVVVGVAAFVGTTIVLGVREDRRTANRRGEPAATRAPRPGDSADFTGDGDDESDVTVAGDTPRDRAAITSIRLVTPEADVLTAEEDTLDADPEGGRMPHDDHGLPSPLPFRGKLGFESDDATVRHLRPVPGGQGDAPRDIPGGGRTTGGHPVEQPGASEPPDDEE